MTLQKTMGLATRDAYGKTLVDLGKENRNIVVLDADLSSSTRTGWFAKEFPDRHFNFGIAEANMVGAAAGLATCGKIPFVSSFACFLVCKSYDQIRMTIAFPELGVKLVSSHGGISVGEDGVSQQSIEDIALMTSFPHMQVIIPADEWATRTLVRAAAKVPGPVYMRTCRPKAPILYNEKSSFEIGKGVKLRDGRDVALLATGLLVYEALAAAETLAAQGIQASVIDLHTIKPLDTALILAEAKKTGAIVTCEEHQIWGGLGSAVSRLLAQEHPTPTEFVAIADTYAESGTAEELLEKYGLTAPHIVRAAQKVLQKKKR